MKRWIVFGWWYVQEGLTLKSRTKEIRGAETESTNSNHQAREGLVFGIQRENLRRLVLDIVRRGVDQIKAEYESPKMFNRTVLLTKVAMDANLQRCRYTDVQCWDETRVRLVIPSNNPNDFIHANYVRHHLLLNQFICTQGPLDSTIEDLWRLVWQERCCLILMLCQCVEVQKIKAADYWPKVAGESKRFGPFTITTTDVDNNLGEMRLVEHRQLMDWPDKSVPRIATDVLKLLIHPKSMPNNPTLVHCSAGAGRSGTLVLIELVIRHLLVDRPQKVSIPNLLKVLRAQRSHSVQTEDQYVFAHFAIVQYALLRKACAREEVITFVRAYETYLSSIEQSNKSKKRSSRRRPGPNDDEKSDKTPNATPRKDSTRRRPNNPSAAVKKSNESLKPKPSQH
ncbi:hypothetical protein M3Y96_01154500 [Aphelenchoides besseyi]|nr:hypothetical protein M3Y96_01154500 [Aphelenchoides besseyi]